MTKPVILTGVRANNDLHIGNYFGAILPIIDMARRRSAEYTVNLFIPLQPVCRWTTMQLNYIAKATCQHIANWR